MSLARGQRILFDVGRMNCFPILQASSGVYTSKGKVSDKPQASCDCDLSDCSAVEIASLNESLTLGCVSNRVTMLGSATYREILPNLLYNSNVNTYLKQKIWCT